MRQSIIKRFGGLQLTRNSFENEGLLEIAENIIINYDNIIQSRRGMGYFLRMPSGQLLNNIFIYRNETLAISQNKLYLVKKSLNATAATTAGSNIVIVTLTAHGLTTGAYIGHLNTKKSRLSSYFATRQKSFGDFRQIVVLTANTFSFAADDNATVTESNIPVSFDYYVEMSGLPFNVTPTGVNVSRSTKANKNFYFTANERIMKLEDLSQPLLAAGVPGAMDLSGETFNTTPKGNGYLKPDTQIAYKITFSRRDANKNFVEGSPSPSAVFVNSTQTSTSNSYTPPNITVNSNPLNLVTGDLIYVVSSTGGGTEAISGFVFPVTVSGSTFSFNVSGFGVTGAPTSLKYGLKRNVRLRYTIPKGITTEYRVNIYRSSPSASQTSTPFENYKLVEEAEITAGQIAVLAGEYIDDLEPELIQSNNSLYTNPSFDGPLQLNDVPPIANDITTWKGMTFYANTLELPFAELNLIDPSLIIHAATLVIGSNLLTLFKDPNGLGNEITTSNCTVPTTGVLEITTTTFHGFVVGTVILVYQTTGITAGVTINNPIQVTVTTIVSPTVFRVSDPAFGTGTGTVRFQGVRTPAFLYYAKVVEPSTTVTLSEAIDRTARNICRANNIIPSNPIDALYLFDPDSAPGRMKFVNRNNLSFSIVGVLSPFLPNTSPINSDKTDKPAGIYWSKINQPESVPPVNFAIVGDADKRILRIAGLKDSLIVLKEDGVFRINGDSPQTLSIVPLDTTVFCLSPDTVRVLNNSVFCLSNQGFVQISDTSVTTISRDIEPVVTSTFAYNLENVSSAVSSDTERMYMCSTIKPNTANETANIVRVYNYYTQTWTDFASNTSILFNGEIDAKDRVVGIPFVDRNFMVIERKDFNRIDYVEEDEAIFAKQGRFMSGTATSGSSSVVFTVTYEHNFKVGDFITVSNVQSSLLSAFSTPSDLLGIRVVTAVTETTFTISASNNAIANGVGDAIISEKIREYVANVNLTTGSNIVVVTTTEPHNLSTGSIVSVEYASQNVETALTLETNITGSRVVTFINPTQFSITANVVSTSTLTGTISFSTNNKEIYLAVKTTTPCKPGYCVLGNNTLNQIIEVVDSNQTDSYSLRFVFQNKDSSYNYNRLGTYIRNRIKFSPLNSDNTALLKQAPEFQCSFRNSISCSSMTLTYSNDSRFNSKQTEWDNLKDKKQVFLGGWGQLDWGEFPWGAELSINKQFLTQPAVILRTYVPIEAAIGTFIQVALEHKRAGESIDLQSIALLTKEVTERTSR